MYTSYEIVKDNLDANTVEDEEAKFRIVLGDDDTAWCPWDSEELFQGPGWVTYRRLNRHGAIMAIYSYKMK